MALIVFHVMDSEYILIRYRATVEIADCCRIHFCIVLGLTVLERVCKHANWPVHRVVVLFVRKLFM